MADKHNPQVAQLFAERENAVAYGQTTRIEAVDKQLDRLGVKVKAAEERKAATEDKGKAPQNRRASGKSEA